MVVQVMTGEGGATITLPLSDHSGWISTQTQPTPSSPLNGSFSLLDFLVLWLFVAVMGSMLIGRLFRQLSEDDGGNTHEG